MGHFFTEDGAFFRSEGLATLAKAGVAGVLEVAAVAGGTKLILAGRRQGTDAPVLLCAQRKKNIDQWNYGNKFSATFPESYFDPQLVNGDVSGQDGAADEGGGGHHGQEPPRRGGSLQSTHR